MILVCARLEFDVAKLSNESQPNMEENFCSPLLQSCEREEK